MGSASWLDLYIVKFLVRKRSRVKQNLYSVNIMYVIENIFVISVSCEVYFNLSFRNAPKRTSPESNLRPRTIRGSRFRQAGKNDTKAPDSLGLNRVRPWPI
jgi:hypothetical protein